MSKKHLFFFALLLGVLLRLFYFSYTDAFVRQHDVGGHLDHIHLIQRELALPANARCWECFQPPAYYVTAAAVSSALAPPGDARLVQLVSLCLSIVFLIFSLLLLRALFSEVASFALAAALLVLWPSGVMSSVRVGNDVAFYAAYACGLWYLYRWAVDGRRRDLLICASVAAFSVLVKSSGFLLWAMLGGVVVLRSRSSSRSRLELERGNEATASAGASLRFKDYFSAGCILFLGFASWVACLILKRADSFSGKSLIGISQFPESQRVGTGVMNFLYFDVMKFVSFPDAGPWTDLKGRQYFWNYAWKTALVGEFDIKDPFHQVLAIALSVLFLIMLIFAVIGAARAPRGVVWRLLVLNFVVSVLALFVMRVWQPANCLNDFRYIFPAILSVIAFAVLGAETRSAGKATSGVRHRIGFGVMLTFAFVSALYFLVPIPR